MSQVLISLFHVECFCWIGSTNSNVLVYFQEDKSHPVYSNELMTSQLMAPCAIRRINHCVINWTVSVDVTVLNPLMNCYQLINCFVCHQLKCFGWWHSAQCVDELSSESSTKVIASSTMPRCYMVIARSLPTLPIPDYCHSIKSEFHVINSQYYFINKLNNTSAVPPKKL